MTTPAPSTTAVADARIPSAHPFTAHLRRVAALETGQPHRPWTPDDAPLPSLYLSHGGGPLPFQSPEWLDPLHAWARALPKPKAILVVSAHWEEAPVTIGATSLVPLVYDFWGFPERSTLTRFGDGASPSAATSSQRPSSVHSITAS